MTNRLNDEKNIDLLWRIFLQTGDHLAYSAIYNRYADELYSYGIHMGFQKEMCKDAIHDLFYKLFTSRETIKKAENPAAYLFRSFKHRLIDILRKESRTRSLDMSDTNFTIDISISDQIIDREEAFRLKERVEKLLASLSDRERETIYLRFTIGLSYPEIGEILKINSDSVRKSVFRIMEKLRKKELPPDQ